MTREEALIIWRSMSKSEQMALWQWNTKTEHFSKTWNFAMFASSTSTMWQAMCRRDGVEMEGF